MTRILFAAMLVLPAAVRAAPAQPGQLDASITLFTVMAAINAAGFDAELASGSNHPLRDAVRAELARRKISCLPELKKFVADHRRKNDTVELSQYISFALSVTGPPDFAFRMRDVEIPPDAAVLRELSPLLGVFYREAGIEDLWNRSQRAIDHYLARYHAPVTQAVLEVNAYLRSQTSGIRNRRFQIFVELLAPPNQIQTRSYGDEYTIVITPSAQPRIHDVRHAYLHYLLDPLATRAREVLERKRGLADHAQRAGALDDSFKEDFLLLVTESLIKAVEARLDRQPDEVTEALKEGFILAPYFFERLPAYEKQEVPMQYYFGDLAAAIDLRTEDARLSKTEFYAQPRVRRIQAAPPPPEPVLTGAAKTLDEAERLYAGSQLDNAKQLYLKVLQETSDRPVHAKAYYGLARIAARQKDPEVAERLFQKTLECMPEAQVKAWTLVYLGRLAAARGDADEAAKQFRSALGVEGASEAARKAAQEGVSQSGKQPPQP